MKHSKQPSIVHTKEYIYRKATFRLLPALACLAVCLVPVWSQPIPDAPEPVLVGIHEFTPFVMRENDLIVGFDAEIWRSIADRLGIDFEFKMYPDIAALIDGVERGEIMAGIGGITVNSQREERIDFTHGYYESGLQILALSGRENFVKSLARAFTSRAIVVTLMFFLVFVFVAGLAYWFFEHDKALPHSDLKRGLADGMWLSYITATTIGYGDIAPRSFLGRLATIPISLVGFMVIGSISGVIASLMTVDRLKSDISGVQDLRGRPVAIKEGTATVAKVAGYGLAITRVDSNEEAYQLVESGKVTAFIHDAPALRYYANTRGAGKVATVGETFAVHDYGIALPDGSELREPINRAILQLIENGVFDRIKQKYGI